MKNLLIVSIFFVFLSSDLIAQDNSLSFDGNDDYAEYVLTSTDYSSGGDFYFDGSLTMEAWFKSTNVDGTILSCYSHTAAGHGDPWVGLYSIFIDANGFLQSNIRDSAGHDWASWVVDGVTDSSLFPTEVNDGSWHHIAVVYDEDSSAVFAYLDGGVKSTKRTHFYEGGIINFGTINPTNPIKIGVSHSNAFGYSKYLNGILDEISIWKRALTLEEIQNNMYQIVNPSMETDLSGYWKFDEGTGSYISDSSGNNHNGSIYGPIWITDVPPNEPSSQFHYSLFFDGIDDFVDCQSAGFDFAPTNLTQEAWIKLDITDKWHPIMTRRENRSGPDWVTLVVQNGYVSFGYDGDHFWYGITGTTFVTDGEWHHVAGTKEGNTLNLYVDGNFEGTYNGSHPFGTSERMSLGRSGAWDYDGPYYGRLSGFMTEVRTWDIALTQSDIINMMFTTLNGDEEGLVGYWGFIEGTGETLEDLSVNSNNGVIYGASWSIDVPNNEPSTLKNNNKQTVDFQLKQNYPNPFNPSTKIKFSIPNNEFVILEVYNLLGQKIVSLINGEMNSGYHEVEFDGSELSSNIYFYSIQAGNFHDIKKMILLK